MSSVFLFFSHDALTIELSTLSLHDALPIFLATFYQQEDKNDKALQVFEKILEIDPGNSRAHLAVIQSKSNDAEGDNLLSLQSFFLNSKIYFVTKFGKISHFFNGVLNVLKYEDN